MKKIIVKLSQYRTTLMLAAAVLMSFAFLPSMASANGVSPLAASSSFGLGQNDPAASLGLGTTALDDAVVGLINVMLGFLGLIAVVIILIGGFRWMTAGGNEDKVGQARKTIFAGIIGLAIILFAWGITIFVVQQLGKASGAEEFQTL
ncbi:MAG: hypothetical protein COX83_03930 [Candidatus Magasanikbacteria bacterium CG_4_10_14_0_2_um_filter_41_31]|uniref:DUF4190 domain-containing protein n=1 Tax=Candidatus Magasanikbacteria bacterium CG_4_10_14_0_2_um_filter_41_31 TaxID=1974639 RepID=A0A2M7V2F6_9BACT|nr:MAG: hypothetical protein COX83_03930 [Candidatus Magasanikbacteria bacterium CG_4_10_14_0_2_um_filter_41_31]